MSWWSDATGRTARLTRTFTASDLDAYTQVSGDAAPPGEVPEPLIAGLFSTLLGMHLPGPGTNYLKQSLDFVSPALIGEEVRAAVTITSVRPEKRLVYLDTICHAGDRAVCRGQALVLARGVVPVPGPGTD